MFFCLRNREESWNSFGVIYDRSQIEGEDTRLVGANYRRAWGTQRLEKYLSLQYLNENNRITDNPIKKVRLCH